MIWIAMEGMRPGRVPGIRTTARSRHLENLHYSGPVHALTIQHDQHLVARHPRSEGERTKLEASEMEFDQR